jgi:hypothetical protein
VLFFVQHGSRPAVHLIETCASEGSGHKRHRPYPPRKEVIELNQSHTANQPHGANIFTDRYKVNELTEASTDSPVATVRKRGGIVTEFRAYGIGAEMIPIDVTITKVGVPNL